MVCNVAETEGGEPIMIVKCNQLSSTRPWLEDTSSANFEAAKIAIQQVYKVL